MALAANGLVVAGALLLVISLVPVRRLALQLPRGSIRRRWSVLGVLILFFLIAYVLYGFINWFREREAIDLIVPLVFFLGSIFVLLVSNLSLLTAMDVRRISTLEAENITDPLMGIHNRRYLDRRLDEEVDRALRYGFPLSILLIDIDHFKQVNDRYGHQAGDEVLRTLGSLIAQSIRRSDVVARYGGEELLVIATHTNLTDSVGLAERLRKAVEELPMPLEGAGLGRQRVKVTVSIGVAGLRDQNGDREVLIQDADEALYQAKRGGRNRVEHRPHAADDS